MDTLFELIGNIIKTVVNFIVGQIEKANDFVSKVGEARRFHSQNSYEEEVLNEKYLQHSSPDSPTVDKATHINIDELSSEHIESLSTIELSDVGAFNAPNIENTTHKKVQVSPVR